MPLYIGCGDVTRARVCSQVAHVFGTEKRRMRLIVHTIGQVQAAAKITLTNLAYNMRRLVWIGEKSAPA